MMGGRSFGEFMAEKRTINRWFVVKVAIAGAFFGTLLTVAYMVSSVGVWF